MINNKFAFTLSKPLDLLTAPMTGMNAWPNGIEKCTSMQIDHSFAGCARMAALPSKEISMGGKPMLAKHGIIKWFSSTISIIMFFAPLRALTSG
jgi:hypothetical protein